MKALPAFEGDFKQQDGKPREEEGRKTYRKRTIAKEMVDPSYENSPSKMATKGFTDRGPCHGPLSRW